MATPPSHARTSSHALLDVFVANDIDRVFVVPGESYLGLLDALSDFPQIDVVTCRHEGGASFMACADGRLTGRPGVVMVSRGPGATNAAIGLHTAEQDAVPLILVVGQVPKKDLRRGAFQEIDYRAMFGTIAKWVCEVTDPAELAAAAHKAIRVACSGAPGPVVLVVPEDVQQATVSSSPVRVASASGSLPLAADVQRLSGMLRAAKRPLAIVGGALARDGGRDALYALATQYRLPVVVSFRQHDLFPNTHPLYAGDLGLVNPSAQLEAFQSSDLIFALGTRLGDITTQGYSFPDHPHARQTVVQCYNDSAVVARDLAVDMGLVCDPIELARALASLAPADFPPERAEWTRSLRSIRDDIAAWPMPKPDDRVPFVDVVRSLQRQAPADLVVCLDAGSFAAPVYRHFPFVYPQRLMAPLSGAMGYGTPAAIACALRLPKRKIACLVGDGGFAMTGNEMIAAVERRLPVLFILSNNGSYGSIRIHQERTYPGRHVGTSLTNPDFTGIARAFGMQAERVDDRAALDAAIARGLSAVEPRFIEIATSLAASLPLGAAPPHAAFD